MRRFIFPFALILMLASGMRGEVPSTTPTPYDWSQLDRLIGARGEFKDDVYTFTLPRADLNVAIDGMDVPAAAGVASVFHFFRCPCGKIRVVGQFACAEWESNDVIDAIRQGDMLAVASLSPMFVGAKPQVMIVRFQGEGDGPALAQLLKAGLGWIGPARSATQPIK